MNEQVSKTLNHPVSLKFHDTANGTCLRIEESLTMLHRAIDRLIPPRPKDNGKASPPDPKHSDDYQPTISEQQALLANRLVHIQETVSDAVNRLEEFV